MRQRTSKQSAQHILRLLIPSKDVLIEYSTNALLINLALEERQKIGIMLLFPKALLEIGSLVQVLNNLNNAGDNRALIGIISLVGGADILGRSPESIDAQKVMRDMIWYEG